MSASAKLETHFMWAKSRIEQRALEKLGWKVAPQRRSHHSKWAILMIWDGEGEPPVRA